MLSFASLVSLAVAFACSALAVACSSFSSAASSSASAAATRSSGAAPVVSLTEPYAAWTDGLALTAATPKEFLKQIRWLVANRDAAPELAASGRRYALAERTIDRSIQCWREAISGPRHRRYQKGNKQ